MAPLLLPVSVLPPEALLPEAPIELLLPLEPPIELLLPLEPEPLVLGLAVLDEPVEPVEPPAVEPEAPDVPVEPLAPMDVPLDEGELLEPLLALGVLLLEESLAVGVELLEELPALGDEVLEEPLALGVLVVLLLEPEAPIVPVEPELAPAGLVDVPLVPDGLVDGLLLDVPLGLAPPALPPLVPLPDCATAIPPKARAAAAAMAVRVVLVALMWGTP